MSPAWGVGCWFVPVVNFWMPYLAVRGCLPADDPRRPRILAWWLAWVGAQLLGTAAGIAAMFSSGTALALSLPAAAADLAAAAWAPGIVTAIAAAHHSAVDGPAPPLQRAAPRYGSPRHP